MSRKKTSKQVSVRVRLDQETLERITLHAGEIGREKFIRDAILAKLDEAVPPAVMDLMEAVEDLRERVGLLERAGAATMSLGPMSEEIKTKVCRDDFDRKILSHIMEQRGATTTELAEVIGGKTRTIRNRIAGMNERAIEILGGPILELIQGEHKGKKRAWWPTEIIYS